MAYSISGYADSYICLLDLWRASYSQVKDGKDGQEFISHLE
jgi:hypothetical protein